MKCVNNPCPCCKSQLIHESDFMEHIELYYSDRWEKCGYYYCYDTGRTGTSFEGKWGIYTYYTFTTEQFKKAQKIEQFREKVWSMAWPILKPLFVFLNKKG